MRLLLTVQRYGEDVAGGAEAACRDVAERLAARGHDVHVVTSCARSYMTWADEFDPGQHEIAGVTVHRLPVRHERDPDRFGALNAKIVRLGDRSPDSLQDLWQAMQGPDLLGLAATIRQLAPTCDLVVCFTYLYATTHQVVAVARELGVPVALVPCAHEEPHLRLRVNRRTLEAADGHLFLTTEEAALIRRVIRRPVPSHTVGLGTDVGAEPPDQVLVDQFRHRHGRAGGPLVYVGRIDPNKAADWLARLHAAWNGLGGGRDAELVMVGDPVVPLPDQPCVAPLGWVSAEEREAAMAGSLALAHPSPYESFALTLIETWALGRPVLVHADSPVLAGQVSRSGAGLVFRDLPSYDVAVDALVHRDGLADELGARGRRFVEAHYRWDAVLDRWEQALSMIGRGRLAPG